MDRSDAVIVREDPVRGPPERTRYEPTSTGTWRALEEYHNGCQWVVRGCREVESLGFEGVPPQYVDELEVES